MIAKILFLLFCELCLTLCQISIPKNLRECYTADGTLDIQIPLNLRVLIDLVRRAEKHSYATLDMRTMSSSLLHRFKFDGIEYQKDVRPVDGVLPFSGTGTQRTKNKLIEDLVPGNPDVFPSHLFDRTERCLLHRALSNTVMKYKLQNADKACHDIGHTEKILGRTVVTGSWDCPRQHGVIMSLYGTVSLGTVIGAIAASLQRQSVPVNQLMASTTSKSPQNSSYNEDEVDFVMPRSQMIRERSMWLRSLEGSLSKIDNVWLSTIAGELAEMAVYQGPLVGEKMVLGATGFWNNTMRPIIFYLTTPYDNFDATRAELIAGVDGLIIASNLHTWVQDFYSLRLSQVLEMYYSDSGVAFNTNVKACNRAKGFLHAVPKTVLLEQTYSIAQALAYRKSIAHISPESLTQMVGHAVEKFSVYSMEHLFAELPCDRGNEQPRVEALVVIDGSWSVEYTMDFLAVLIQNLDVSMYGSKMGIIHGTSGEWMLNVTDSPSLAFQTIHNFTDVKWPERFNYTRTLETIYTYLNKTWEENHDRHVIGNLGQVVVYLIPLATLSTQERTTVMPLLKSLKYHHPDVHFIYYMSQYNAKLYKHLRTSKEDYLIKNSNIDAITQYILTIPRAIRPIMTLVPNASQPFTPQLEDYVGPTETVTYRMHSRWRRNTKRIPIAVHTFGYGAMTVCSWSQFKVGERKVMDCKDLSGHKDVTMEDHFRCTEDNVCPDTYYRVQNVTSLYKCAEIDCKSPDQVRFIIRTQNVYYNGSPKTRELTSLSEVLLLLFIQIYFVRT